VTDFVKYQALGNDYLVVDPNLVLLTPTPQAIRLLCDRHLGVGADGVLLGPIGPVQANAPVRLRIFNPDGSECERSGNGLRMFALYLAQHYLACSEFAIRTVAGDARAVLHQDEAAGAGSGSAVVSVEMGMPRFDAVDEPLPVGGREVRITAVHNGNPHAVVHGGDVPSTPSAAVARELGPLIAGHERFPGRTNVQFLCVVDRATIRIEIWERGAGYTLASGSSGCAAASAAHHLGLVDRRVTVQMPGGQVLVDVGLDGVTLTGPVEEVMTGTFAVPLRAALGLPPEFVSVPVGAVRVAGEPEQ
jgi:diaminopimelate epimerase